MVAAGPGVRGRPRAYCETCRPQNPVLSTQIWRADNHAAIIEKRRADYPPKTVTVCARCGRESLGRVDKQYCSTKCRQRGKEHIAIACARCSKSFTPRNSRVRYCSPRCEKRAHNSSGGISPRRRARIFERDEWTCVLCSEAVDRRLTFPHPQAATIDHALPVALWKRLYGSHRGAHTEVNLQTAHLICNVRKLDRAVITRRRHSEWFSFLNTLLNIEFQAGRIPETGLKSVDYAVVP